MPPSPQYISCQGAWLEHAQSTLFALEGSFYFVQGSCRCHPGLRLHSHCAVVQETDSSATIAVTHYRDCVGLHDFSTRLMHARHDLVASVSTLSDLG